MNSAIFSREPFFKISIRIVENEREMIIRQRPTTPHTPVRVDGYPAPLHTPFAYKCAMALCLLALTRLLLLSTVNKLMFHGG